MTTVTMSAATCSTLAQILPVFLIGLIAGEVVRSRRPLPFSNALVSFVRGFLEAATVLLIFALETVLILGVQSDGIRTEWKAQAAWSLTAVVAAAILTRWLTLSPNFIRIQMRMTRRFAVIMSKIAPTKKGRLRWQQSVDAMDRNRNRMFVMDPYGSWVPADKDGNPKKQKPR